MFKIGDEVKSVARYIKPIGLVTIFDFKSTYFNGEMHTIYEVYDERGQTFLINGKHLKAVENRDYH